MRNYVIILLLCTAIALMASEVDTLFILNTTDVHAELLGFDFTTRQPRPQGLARVQTLIDSLRNHHHNVLLLDCGDMMQGNILAYYYNHEAPDMTHPLMDAMNVMAYDAATVGNHELEQGSAFMQRLLDASDFPWLAANSTGTTGEPVFQPYTIIRRGELSIGIIGLTVPVSPSMVPTSARMKIQWSDMVETARRYAEELRPKVDLLIGMFHAGFDATEGTLLPGRPVPNASRMVAEQVPGFDLILGGHTHHTIPPAGETIVAIAGEPLKIMAGSHGKTAALITAEMEKTSLGWHPRNLTASMISLATVKPDSQMVARYQPAYQQVNSYMDAVVCSTAIAISTHASRREDTAAIDLINRAQLAWFDADISFSSSFTTSLEIPPGPITVRDVFALYPYENTLFLVEMTGRQVHNYLRWASRYYRISGDSVLANPAIPGYQYDIAEGIGYQINVTNSPQILRGNRPVTEPDSTVANRIEKVVFLRDGSTVSYDDNRTYRVVINSYRMFGGGQYIVENDRVGYRVLEASTVPARQVLTRYLGSLGMVKDVENNNWQVITGAPGATTE